MHMPNIVFVLTLSLLMAACSSSDDTVISRGTYLPNIGAINTDILHSHPSFHSKWGIAPERNIRFTISAKVSDPQGIDNLKHVSAREVQDDVSWSLLGGSDGVPLHECYQESLGIFECVFYSSGNLETILLEDWELVAEDEDGNVTSKRFQFRVPGGDLPSDLPNTERFVYSSEYAGSSSGGIEGLEAMTIVDSSIVFTADLGTRSFHIEFETSDTRVAQYEFAFYDVSSGIRYMGSAESDSPSISSMSVVPGQPLVIDVPWSEITFEEGFFDPTNIGGLHIKLLDSPVDGWFNYVGYSEFIEL